VPFDLSYILFFVSLGVSAVAVALFLWLMRQEPEGGRRKEEGEGSKNAGDGEDPASRLPPPASRR
jgi:hypothetical protein